MARQKKVLLLCNYYPGTAGAIMDHIHAFTKYSTNEYFTLSNMGNLPDWLDLSRFDALVFHYSLVACYDSYISPAGRKRIREFNGYKAAFVQDDYRWINDTVNAFAYMKINALFPLTAPGIMDQVYSPKRLPFVRKETVLAGYVPEDLVKLPVKPYVDRGLDVGYRARKLPAWMGSHTLQKWQIAERFLQDAGRYGLGVDISCREEDRIYGDSWLDFISNCKATLGTESGASICDFTGNIQRDVEAHLAKYPDEDFETLKELYFRDEDCRIVMNVISPRCFEAAALRTLMILYEGEYSGVLIPWRHYVPLNRDHSNMDQVVDILHTPDKAQKIIDCAYEEIAKNDQYTYSSMVRLVDRVMEEECTQAFRPGKIGYTREEFDWLCQTSAFYTSSSSRNRVIHIDRFVRVEGPEISNTTRITAIISGPDRVEILLDTILYLNIVAIRWDNEAGQIPHDCYLQLFCKDAEVGSYAASNREYNPFQIIRIDADMSGVDRVRIIMKGISESVSCLPYSMVITGTNVRYRDRLKWLKKCWHWMPLDVRDRLRPLVNYLLISSRRVYMFLTRLRSTGSGRL